MSNVSPKIPWKLWFRIHAKAIAQAIPISFLIVVESRDMYYRATWQVSPLPLEGLHPGDVISICNRWYTMPTWQHVWYSLCSKVLLKSCWDDAAVVSSCDPSSTTTESIKILYCDFDGAHEVSLAEFINQRRPRGLAVRQIRLDSHSRTALNPAISSLFVNEVTKMKARPWYLFNASWRVGHENKYYEFVVGMHLQRVKIKKMIDRGQSRESIINQQRKLQDMEVMRSHLRKFTEDSSFRLFNGSLVASFLAAYDLIDRHQPPPSRYVPQDFSHDVPFNGATELSSPIVFYKL